MPAKETKQENPTQEQLEKEKPKRILRLKELKSKTGLGSTTIYDMVAKGTFPAQVQLSPGTSGWFEHEIDEWLDSRPRQKVKTNFKKRAT